MTKDEMLAAQARRTADKYITSDGRTPTLDEVPPSSLAKDILNVTLFLAWAAENRELYGGVFGEAALSSFSRIVRIPVRQLRKVALGE